MAGPQGFLNFHRECSCGQRHLVPVQRLVVEPGALHRLPQLLASQGPQRRLHLVSHVPAWKALPCDLVALLEASGFQVSATIYPEGDLVPDEAARDHLAASCPADVELLLAVGSGVVHDLTRVEAHRRGRELDSVPTAPSMDGFASGVAPLLVDGFKVTVPASPPRAIWADLDVLVAAPEAMILAGVGDLMGKSVCLRDWELGALLTGERFCPFLAGRMEEAWIGVRDRLSAVKRREPEAIRALMEGLVLSGLGMVMAEGSRPASGAEHHLSHFWELLAHPKDRPAPLHGLKVAAGTLLVAQQVERLAARQGGWKEAPGFRSQAARRGVERSLRRVYGPLAPSVLAENFLGTPLRVLPSTLERHDAEVQALLARYPSSAEVEGWFASLGLDPGLDWLGVTRRQRSDALRWAPYLRNRYTVLRLRDQASTSDLKGPVLAGLAAVNLGVAALLWSAGVIASSAWPGGGRDVRDLASRWTYDEGVRRWLVVSEFHGQEYRTRWDQGRWVTSSSAETAGENSRTRP